MARKLNALALGSSAAIVSAAIMLVLGILGTVGIYTRGVEMMQKWHLFFSLTIQGIIAGMLEATAVSFLIAFSLGWLYNLLGNET